MKSARFQLFILAIAAVLTAASAAAQSNEPSGEAIEVSGYLYGTITAKSGSTYTGLMRWGGEEAFWDDLFNSDKKNLPHKDGSSKGGRTFTVLGKEFRVNWGNWSSGRPFVARFGDIEAMTIIRGDEVELKMRDGSEIRVEGGSNDVNAKIAVQDATVGDVTVPWDKIERIDFKAAPAGTRPNAYRLYGTVETDERELEGYIQWDKQECLSTDILNGEDDDIELEIPMGKIVSIANRGNASHVVFRDGSERTLDGTNDVDDDNRGILVEDPTFGRVEVPWEAFEKVTFTSTGASGLSFNDYTGGGPLFGTVYLEREQDGRTSIKGRLVYDRDETYFWEMLDGDEGDLSYSVPFAMIAKIEPRGSSSSMITMRSGQTIRLDGSNDVDNGNDGVLVFSSDSDEAVEIDWEDIERIEFDAPQG